MAAHRSSPVIDKGQKYDRQLRLWGDHGQTALESAHICLINAGATGTEILKNLCLPGVGAFTVVDANKVKGEDVGNNFFLEKDSIGLSRAKAATELLLELNNDVRGDFVEENNDDSEGSEGTSDEEDVPELDQIEEEENIETAEMDSDLFQITELSVDHILQSNPQFFEDFSVVIATELPERTLLDLDSILWGYNVPLLVCRSYGMMGYMRLVAKEHTVVESHPDNAHEDLRLDQPFPGLVNLVETYDLNSMTKQEHMHTPYLILLYKFLVKWKLQHNGVGPKNYKEKKEFKELLQTGVRTNSEGVPELEENFDEAIAAVNASLVPTGIPSSIQEILSDQACQNLSASSSNFWILAQAVDRFIKEGAGRLPLRGSIPDMTADSKRYIQLQNVYREQAKQDSVCVASHVQQILASLGKSQDRISEGEIKLFCKNVHFLRIVRCRSLADEYNTSKANVSDIAMHLENPDSELVFYVLLRAVDRFYSQYNRFPGIYDSEVESDILKLTTCTSGILHDWGVHTNLKEEYIRETCRYGAAELHTIAAFLGGSAAQEVIKVVTRQFVPFNNTFIYNAMTGASATFQL